MQALSNFLYELCVVLLYDEEVCFLKVILEIMFEHVCYWLSYCHRHFYTSSATNACPKQIEHYAHVVHIGYVDTTNQPAKTKSLGTVLWLVMYCHTCFITLLPVAINI